MVESIPERLKDAALRLSEDCDKEINRILQHNAAWKSSQSAYRIYDVSFCFAKIPTLAAPLKLIAIYVNI